ncbi:MAG: ribonuclease III, partial [Bacteroidales bacterium]|nr:ribonuclease III [Bacteroidales bacterium]
ILLNRIIDHYFDLGVLENQELNYKSKIIEWAQKERNQLQFKVIDEVGSGYRKQYIVAVVVNGKVVAQSQHYSIKGAEQLSAEKAWMQIPQSERD